MTPWRPLAEKGPLLPPLELQGRVDWAAWGRAALALEARLPSGPFRDRRIHHLYVPTLLWLLAETACAAPSTRPRVVGLCAPQGAGKSTLVRELLPLLRDGGLRVAAVSIDDFYLPRDAQVALAVRHPGNRVLEHRGAPGTHDIALGDSTLDALRHLGPGAELRVPAYDKTAHGGRGDRVPPGEWPVVHGPLDLVLVEGWCLAFRPVDEASLSDRALLPVNAALADYARWHRHLDALVTWRAFALEQIVDWRVEAEERSRAAGRPGLDRAASEDYIRRFLPVYETYAHTATASPPPRARQLEVILDADRLPLTPSPQAPPGARAPADTP
jgi:D-glycerate 3-kinase